MLCYNSVQCVQSAGMTRTAREIVTVTSEHLYVMPGPARAAQGVRRAGLGRPATILSQSQMVKFNGGLLIKYLTV